MDIKLTKLMDNLWTVTTINGPNHHHLHHYYYQDTPERDPKSKSADSKTYLIGTTMPPRSVEQVHTNIRVKVISAIILYIDK